MNVDVFPIDWKAQDAKCSQDTDTEQFEIQMFGKTPEGVSTTVHITFYPYFFVGVPGTWSAAKTSYFIGECVRKYRAYAPLSMPVRRKTLYSFTNNEARPFVQLAFRTLADFKKAKYGLQREKLQTYEASLDPLLRFFHVRNISPASWVSISCEAAQKDIRIDFRSVSPSSCTHRPPLVFASWDIEAISATNKFPCSDIPGDKVITIGTAFQRYGEAEPYHRSVVTLDTCDPIEGVEVVPCQTEADVVTAWIDQLRTHEVDVMLGYNTFQFDFRYVYGRTLLCVDEYGSPQVDLSLFGKGGSGMEGAGEPIEKQLSSAAYGDNKFFVLRSPGILQIDLLQIFRKDLKLESYSLANVSTKFLDGHSKLDLLPGEIFSKFRGTSTDRATIAEYCIRDVELPLKLMSKMTTFENLLEMSNACYVPIEYLIMRGQQIKVYSLLLRKARALGFVAPDIDRNSLQSDGKYEGATVLDAQKGGYFDVVSGLDFASLYPSIMRAHNMCPSTLVLNEDTYGALESVEYYTVRTTDGTVHKFAQNVPSVVPALLEELAAFRKQAKKDMAVAKDSGDAFRASLYNAKQLAFKVSMNSVYGFFGAIKGGMFPCIPVAASVTATGRAMIEHSKNLAETLVPGTRVVYGDSVMPGTPVLVRKDGVVGVEKIENLARGWEPYPGFLKDGTDKEQSPCSMQAWTHLGWQPITRVIRHKCHKRIWRVVTHTGLVDVTEDHSLLGGNLELLKPGEVSVGQTLFTSFPPCASQCMPFEADTCPELGGLGGLEGLKGCHHIDTENQVTAQWYYLYLKSLGYDVSINTRHDTPNVFRLTFTMGKLRKQRDEVKKVHVLHETWDEYVYDLETAAGTFQAGVGDIIVKNTDSIMCILKMDDPAEQNSMHAHFKKAEWLADQISKTFKHPIELEFEKCYCPYLLFAKKRYAGLMYTAPDTPDYIDVKGLSLVRRDSAPIVKHVSTKMLDTIMYSRSVQGAIQEAQTMIRDVLLGNISLEHFIVSKQLRANYARPESQPHVIVAKKKLRRTGVPITQGERVPFVFIEDPGNADGLISSRAEDPTYVKDHGLKLDALYYLKNQLLNPITTLLEVLVDNAEEEVLKHPEIQYVLESMESQRKKEITMSKRLKLNASRNQPEITNFFKFVPD